MNPNPTSQPSPERAPYEPPAIVFKGEITTRAGSFMGPGKDGESLPGVDPAELFVRD